MPIYLTLQLAGGAAAPCRRGARWALTPPFHPYHHNVMAVIFCHLNPEVAPSFPLRNAMLCVARTFLSCSWHERQATPLLLAAAKVQNSFYLFINNYNVFSHQSTRIARIALSTASTVTPTSAKTAIHIVAKPRAASSSTAIFTPRANHTF